MRAILAAILRSAGHEVLQAGGVSAAQDALYRHAPDLILTDYDMPGGKGVERVRWVRTRELHDRVPIIVVSSEVNAALHTRMAWAGVDGSIAKPVCVASLIDAVDAVAGQYARACDDPSKRPDRGAFHPAR